MYGPPDEFMDPFSKKKGLQLPDISVKQKQRVFEAFPAFIVRHKGPGPLLSVCRSAQRLFFSKSERVNQSNFCVCVCGAQRLLLVTLNVNHHRVILIGAGEAFWCLSSRPCSATGSCPPHQIQIFWGLKSSAKPCELAQPPQRSARRPLGSGSWRGGGNHHT